MRIDILTLFPEMFTGFFGHSIIRRAAEKGLATIYCHNIRDFAHNKQKQVDDYCYGGGAGMVLMPIPLAEAIESLQKERTYDEVIFLTPDGKLLDQPVANHLSTFENIILISGHYKGIDERIREHFVTREISIGDYVLSGGELPAAVLCDTLIRLIPGVLSDETSALSDSFQNNLLSPPVYTRPSDFRGHKVPDVLLSGNEKEIYQWRLAKAIERTQLRRPGLIDSNPENE
ncbi:MAG: tRNA (guanosine(37)-N1)-methyltransferase TrmD [Bacteroidota bacterium]